MLGFDIDIEIICIVFYLLQTIPNRFACKVRLLLETGASNIKCFESKWLGNEVDIPQIVLI